MLEQLQDATINVAISACSGLAYARLYELNPTLVAKAFVIHSIYDSILQNLPSFPLLNEAPRFARALRIDAAIVGDMVAIIAFRYFNIIANRGTAVLGTLAIIKVAALVRQEYQLRALDM